MKKILLAMLCVLALGACQKKDDTAPDPAQVTMRITSPAEGQVFHSGDTVHILGQVSYPSELHGWEVTLTDSTTQTIVFSTGQHTHDDHFSIDESWVSAAKQRTAFKVSVSAIIDHDGSESVKDIRFSVLP